MKHYASTCLAVLALLFAISISTRAQEQGPKSAPSVPAARPQDVDTLDHIMAAVYDVISGPAGLRDWDRFRSLFYSGVRLIATWRDDKGNIQCKDMSPDDYAKMGAAYFEKNAFFENALANRVELWDRMAHVWSTYESRHAKGEKPFARGINSFQRFFDGARWWVLTIYWEDESASTPLPEKYLTSVK